MKKVRRLRNRSNPIAVAVGIFLTIVCLTYIAVFLWAFLNSLKGKTEFRKDMVSLPAEWKFGNYVKVWDELAKTGFAVPDMLWNSLWYSIGAVLIGNAGCIMFAYVMARFNFPGKQFFNTLNVFMMMVPIMGSLPSLTKMVLEMGIYDSPLYLLTSIGGFGGGLVIYRTAFRSVSWGYAESAYIDGSGHLGVFIKIMLPQVVPIIIAQAVTGFMTIWNSYETILLMLPSYPNLASGLFTYQTASARSLDYPLLFAGCILCAIPTFVLFAFGQKYMMNIDLSGGLKG